MGHIVEFGGKLHISVASWLSFEFVNTPQGITVSLDSSNLCFVICLFHFQRSFVIHFPGIFSLWGLRIPSVFDVYFTVGRGWTSPPLFFALFEFICVELLSFSWMRVFSGKSSKYFEVATRMHRWFADQVSLQAILTNSSLVLKCILSRSFTDLRQSCSKMVMLGPLGQQILPILKESSRSFCSNVHQVLRSATCRNSKCFLRLATSIQQLGQKRAALF